MLFLLKVIDYSNRGKFCCHEVIFCGFPGQEGKSASATTEIVKKGISQTSHLLYASINLFFSSKVSFPPILSRCCEAPPKVTNLKIIGDLREGNKVTVSALVTGGTEGSSRVQWFKTTSPKLEAENFLEAVSTSKIAKVRYLKFLFIKCYS